MDKRGSLHEVSGARCQVPGVSHDCFVSKDKRGGYMYGIMLYLILGILVLIISLSFIFNEYWTGSGGEREVCWQSVQVRALLPDVGTNMATIGSLKDQHPLRCKTNVVEIDKGDLKDGAEDARKKIAEAIVDCWALFGNGDYNAFPAGYFGSASTCVACSRIHLTDDAKAELGSGSINIKAALNDRMRDDFSYYSYLDNSGDRFSAFNFGNAVLFDLSGGQFDIGESGKFDVYNNAEFFLGDFDLDFLVSFPKVGGVKEFSVADMKIGALGSLGVNKDIMNIGAEMNALFSNMNVFTAEGGGDRVSKIRRMTDLLEKGESFEMMGEWDLDKIEGMIYSDVFESAFNGKLLIKGDVLGLSASLAEGMTGDFEVEVMGGNIGSGVSFAKEMEGGIVRIGCGSDVALGVGVEMKEGRLEIFDSKVASVGSYMEGGEILIGSGSAVYGYVGADMVRGEILVEEGVSIGCLGDRDKCGEIESEEDLVACSCIDSDGLICENGMCIRFVEEGLIDIDKSCEKEVEVFGFCKDKRYPEACLLLEDYVNKRSKDDVVVKMEKNGDRDWFVDVRAGLGKNGDGEVTLVNDLSKVKINVSIATQRVRLPEKMFADRGDLIISYGVSVLHEDNFGDHVPYLFYFQDGQSNDPYMEVKHDFLKDGFWSYWVQKSKEGISELVLREKAAADDSSFCAEWDGIPA